MADQLFKGVRIRGDTIQIRVTYKKKRYSKTLTGLRPTKTNLALAAKMRQEALNRIALGEFDLDEFLGVEKKDCEAEKRDTSFFTISQQYLKSVKDRLSESYLIMEIRRLNKHWVPYLGEIPIEDIKYSKLIDVLGIQSHLSAKTKNHNLTVLRNVFNFAVNDEVIQDNVANKIKLFSLQKPEPDPLTFEEAAKIIDYLKKNFHPVLGHYYEFSFFTGMRPSEVNAITWQDIDYDKKVARVNKAIVIREIKDTKTNKVRYIELNKHAINSLRSMQKIAYHPDKEIFLHPTTGQPFNDNSSKVKRKAWTEALQALGIRHRYGSQTRHSFATMYIMRGANLMWVAKQLGHTTINTLLKHYAKWIDNSKYSDIDLL